MDIPGNMAIPIIQNQTADNQLILNKKTFKRHLHPHYYRDIEHRIHLRAKENIDLRPGVEQIVETQVSLEESLEYSMTIRPANIKDLEINCSDNLLGLSTLFPNYTGKIFLHVINERNVNRVISRGRILGTLLLIPYNHNIKR